jgi:hypothetical protein
MTMTMADSRGQVNKKSYASRTQRKAGMTAIYWLESRRLGRSGNNSSDGKKWESEDGRVRSIQG